ncbi:MAG TPA: hypothetical protein EYG86_05175 [Crocinitomicaceae bacterium]|nr:hypothetical protein [Crocinitomicaceae bacterium]
MKISLLIVTLFITSFAFSQMNQVDSQGRKQGKWAKQYEGVRVNKYQGEFKDDKPVGKFTYFYKSSKVKAVIKHEENSNRAEAYYYHPNGSLMSYGIYRNMKKDSVWINFGPSQRISNTETFRNGELNGQKVVFYIPQDPMDKSRRAAAVYNYVNGKLEGESKELFETQVIKTKGQYSNNKKIGKWYTYHVNAKKATMSRYNSSGQRHGYCNAYDKGGEIINRTFYYYGKKLEGGKLESKIDQLRELGIDLKELGIRPAK